MQCEDWLIDKTYQISQKVPVPKLLENEFSLSGRYNHFSNQDIIQGKKKKQNASVDLVCKRFEKTMFILYLLFYKIVLTTFYN